MKILYWTQRFWPDLGGIERAGMLLLPPLRARGYEIIVVASHSHSGPPDEIEFEGIPVYRFPFFDALERKDPRQILGILAEVSKLKQSFRPDLVHVNFGAPSVAFFHFKTMNAHPCPTLISLHTVLSDLGTGQGTLLGDMFHQAGWITACSQAALSAARAACPEIVERSSIVYYGVDVRGLEPAPLDWQAPHILCFGRLAREKGFDLAIEAFTQIGRRFPNAYMTIAGDGPERRTLEQQAKNQGMEARIHLPGVVEYEAVPALLNTAAVVVVPSRWTDAFPLVALEAAHMGRPVVAARVGGLAESVLQNQTGLLIDKEDPQALADAVTRLLDHPGAAEQMGKAARKRAQQLYNPNCFADSYDYLYKKLTRGTTCAS